MNRLSAVFLYFLISWGCADAEEFFVSNGGDDSSKGDLANPWRTIQTAVDRLKPGDSLTVEEGVYPEHVTISVSGKEGKPITIKARKGKPVVLKGGSFTSRDNSFLLLKGFQIVDTRGDRPAIEFTGTGQSVSIVENEIRGLLSQNAAALRVGGRMRDFVIKGNHVHHNVTGNQEAIRVHENTRNFQVIGNEVNDNSNIGIDIVGWAQYGKPSHGLVARNFCHNNGLQAPWASGIYLDGPDDIIVEYNISTGQDFGYQLGCEPSDDSSKGNVLRHNIAYGNHEYGLGIGGYTGGTVHHCEIHNNVFANNKRELGFSKNAGHHNRIVNNIFYNPTGQSINFLARPENTEIDSNCYFTKFGETPGKNSINADPMFANLEENDFTLRAGSPCDSKGIGLSPSPASDDAR